jgi:hypothetical protein
MEPKNREQRRREKYGKAGGVTKEPWPASEANPALSGATGDQTVDTSTPDQDVTTKPVRAVAAPRKATVASPKPKPKPKPSTRSTAPKAD